jgi:predicted DNA binding CopG/RHH family protein
MLYHIGEGVLLVENDLRMTIRVPEAWHRKVKSEAALRGMSLSQLIRTAVDEWLEKNKRIEGGRANG